MGIGMDAGWTWAQVWVKAKQTWWGLGWRFGERLAFSRQLPPGWRLPFPAARSRRCSGGSAVSQLTDRLGTSVPADV